MPWMYEEQRRSHELLPGDDFTGTIMKDYLTGSWLVELDMGWHMPWPYRYSSTVSIQSDTIVEAWMWEGRRVRCFLSRVLATDCGNYNVVGYLANIETWY